MEGLVCVDSVLVARSVAVPAQFVHDVLTVTASVAVPVMAIGGVVTRVRCSGPGPFVGLHDIEFRAVVASDLHRITVAPAVSFDPWGAVLLLAGHHDCVEGGDAAALVIAEVDVVLDRAAHEIGRPVLGVGHVEIRSLGKVASAVARDLDVSGALLNALDSEVHGLLFAVNLDLDRGQTVVNRTLVLLVRELFSLVEWDLGIKVVCHGSSGNES